MESGVPVTRRSWPLPKRLNSRATAARHWLREWPAPTFQESVT